MTPTRDLSPDLLNGLGGIEEGLRRRRSLGRAGGIGLVVLAIVQTGLVISSKVTSVSWSAVMGQWYVFAASILVATVLAVFVATRYWIKESRTPFRYTCRIVPFDAVPPAPEKILPWLRHDLAELLNDRVGRLSFLDKEPEEPEQQEAHIHIAGEYLIRHERDQDDHDVSVIEVTPRVRVGGPTASETLAYAVRYELPALEESSALGDLIQREDYDKILEQIYFSVATRLYKQIQTDVEQKIALLPTAYLRATAYLYEAEDYAQSNTLDAYDDAQELFRKAQFLYDPFARPLPRAWPRRLARRVWSPVHWTLNAFRKALSHIVLRFAKRDAMLARTELGLANTLITRRALARLSGRRVNPIFKARRIAEDARDRLVRLSRIGYRGADEALFDARVVLALVLHYLGSDERAEMELDCARASLPDRAEENPNYLFAAALVEPRTTSALSLLRRAVELNPRFEVAQFERAQRTETLWQFRPDLEETVAKAVIAEYLTVVRINPGNIQAWSSLGHTRWLIAEGGDEHALEEAQNDFKRGLEYKEIKRETFVAGLRYSLARIAAELGRFSEAYGHYVASTTSSIGEGIAHGSWAEQHNSVVRNEAMLGRFDRYLDNVHRRAEEPEAAERVEPRILCSVLAFVENDYGEACVNLYERTAKEGFLTRAESQFEKARQTNARYVIPRYNLCLLNRLTGKLEIAREHIKAVRNLEKKWPEARLEEMMIDGWLSQEPADRWARLTHAVDAHKRRLEELEKSLKEIEAGERSSAIDEARKRVVGSGLGADATEIVSAVSPVDEVRDRARSLESELRRLEGELTKVEHDLLKAKDKAELTVHALVPHEWLWQQTGENRPEPRRRGEARIEGETEGDERPQDKRWEFRWDQVPKLPKLPKLPMPRSSGGRRIDQRWEQLGDLHARALEAWAHTRALSRADETEGGALSRGPWRVRRTEELLRHLEESFWPDRQEGLVARILLNAEPQLEERLGRLAARSLAFDPANYRLLLAANTYLPEDGGGAETRRKAFAKALRERDVAPSLLLWLGDRLDELQAYKDAIDAYGGAAIGRRPDVDKATVLIGKARAEWGCCRYAEAVASLALVPRKARHWRRDFVETLVNRGQINTGTRTRSAAADPDSERNGSGRRLSSLTDVLSLPISLRERLTGASEGDAATLLETEVEQWVGGQALVDWLEVEHAACISAGDFAGATDAARALLLLTAARGLEAAPNRTSPLPDVSASTGDDELDSESFAVPLIRRLSLEMHPGLIFAGDDATGGELADDCWRLVRLRIPEVQVEIEHATGVPIPLPSILQNEHLPEGGFRVLVNELSVREGLIEDGAEYEPIVEAVREAIDDRLAMFVGVDELLSALKAMSADDQGFVANVLDDDAETIQLLQTVRKLIARGAPLPLGDMLSQLLPRDPSDIERLVRSMDQRSLLAADSESDGQAEASLRGPSWAVRR